ncbi:hypothetical protein KY289_021400 [Solanum tuberosum]|nr:hypothetical protein KY289_021400 [Solanum tuberosum]
MDCLKYAMHTAMCLERDYPKRASRWVKDIIDPILNKKEKYVIRNYAQLNVGDEEKSNDTLKYQPMVGALRFFHIFKEFKGQSIYTMTDEQNVCDEEFSLRDSNILYPYVRDQGPMNCSTEATVALYARETSEPPIELSTQQLVDHVLIVYKYEEKGNNRDKVGCYFGTHMDCLKYVMHTAMCLERDYPKRESRWEKDIIDPILNKKEKYVIGNYEQLNIGGEEKINDTLKYQPMRVYVTYFERSWTQE